MSKTIGIQAGGMLFRKLIIITAIQCVLFLIISAIPLQCSAEAPIVLRVGGMNVPLLNSIGLDGKAHGLFPELLDDIARKENWQIQYVHCTADTCRDKIFSGEIDLLLGVAVSDSRKDVFDFNDTTIINSWGQLFTTTSGGGSDIDSVMQLEGVRIAVVKNCIYSTYFKKMIARYGIKPSFVELNSYDDVMTSLENHDVEAGIASSFFGKDNCNIYDVRSTTIVFLPTEVRYVTAKGLHLEVLATIDRHLQQQIGDESSTYHQAFRRMMKEMENNSTPVWVKAIFFSVCLILPLLLAHSVLLTKSVDAKTKSLQLEIAAREESEKELLHRNLELTSLEDVLNIKLKENRSICEALSIAKKQYKKIVNDSPVGIVQTSVDGKLLRINPAFAQMFGYSTTEEMFSLVPNILDRYCLPEQRAKLVQQMLFTEAYVAWTDVFFYRKDGSQFVVRGSMRTVRFEDDTAWYFEGFFTDVTERHKAEIALRESEQLMRLYVQSLPLASFLLDSSGVVQRMNRSAEQMFGYAESEAAGQHLCDLLNSCRNKEQSLACQFIPAGEGTSNYVKENRTKDGRIILCEWTSTRFFDSQGEVRGIISLAQDITAKHQAEEVMVQTEKMMMISGLAAGMAHEINNPMGIIAQNIQNITRRLSPELPANQREADEVGVRLELVREYLERREILEFLSKISTACQRTSKIIANMLQFSRKSNPGRQPGNLAELMDLSFEMASRDSDLRKKHDFSQISIVRNHDTKMPLVPINVVEFEQVMINLIKNAVQAVAAIPPGRKPEIRLSTCCEDGMAVVRVADNGPGMPEDVCKRIFEPFFTTKEVGSGTGLGLYVSYLLITRSARGTLQVDSTPGEGACFTISLPLTWSGK